MCLAREVRLPLGCEVIGQDWSSEVAALFLEDWELGRVALSCHRAMDLSARMSSSNFGSAAL